MCGATYPSSEDRRRPRRWWLTGAIGLIGAARGGFLLAVALPVPGQELVDLLGRVMLQAREHVGEPGLRVDVVEFGGLCRMPNYAECGHVGPMGQATAAKLFGIVPSAPGLPTGIARS